MSSDSIVEANAFLSESFGRSVYEKLFINEPKEEEEIQALLKKRKKKLMMSFLIGRISYF
jgi:hypothetical protein